MKKSYFSADYHFDHKNIIKYDNRPFLTIDAMNEAIIRNHNAVVGPDDDFYFLGDFCFSNRTDYFMSRLNGNKFFIRGNHDHKEHISVYEKYGKYLGEQRKIKIGNQEIILNHYAMRVWNKSHHGVWQLYGHSHGSLPDDPHALAIDVGIMLHDYKPLEFEQIKKIMSKKDYKPVDHHRVDTK